MRYFDVTITRIESVTKTVTVKAPNSLEAEILGQEAAFGNDFGCSNDPEYIVDEVKFSKNQPHGC